MDVGDHVAGQPHRRDVRAGQAAEAVAEPEDVGDAVVVGELEDQAADHVVQPGAQAAARHDPGPRAGRVEVDVLARPAGLERGQVGDAAQPRLRPREGVVEQHAVRLVDVVR